MLMEERQKQQAETEKALEAERNKALALARQVDNLKDLIGRAEQGLDSASKRGPRDRPGRGGEIQGRPGRTGGAPGPRKARAGCGFCLNARAIAPSG